jgi:phytoene dehydrogenase-like protein
MPADHDDPIDTLVVGGGLAGLVAAVAAARAPAGRRARVVLLDAHPLGGRARCDERDGFTFNRGPRALYLGGPAEAELAALGVDVTAGSPAPLKGSRALHGDRLHVLPVGPGSATRTRLLGVAGKAAFARAFARLPRLDPAEHRGRTITELAADLHLTGVPAELLGALVRLSTYVDAPEVLDAEVGLHQVQQASGAGVRYLDGGWQALVDGLAVAAAAAGVDVRTGTAARAVEPAGEGRPARVATASGPLEATTVVLATGTPDAAAALLGGTPPWDALGPPATAACLELGLRRRPEHRFVLGIDEPLYLSTHAPPARLAPEGHAVVHVLRYQGPDDDVDHDLQRDRLRRLAAQAGVTDDDIVTERFLASMTVTGAIPAAARGGLAGRPALDATGHPGVLLAGDWVGPTGLLADAAVASGREAGRAAARRSGTMAVV